MNTRLEQFLAAENISQAQFADTLGVARASISHILAGRNKPGYEFITNLMRSYPALNIEWLLIGKGKMYKNAAQNTMPPVPEVDKSGIFDSQRGIDDGIAEQSSLFEDDNDNSEVIENEVVAPEVRSSVHSAEKQIKKVIVLYSDGSYSELV